MEKIILGYRFAFILMLSSFLTLKAYSQDVPPAPSDVHIDQNNNLLMVRGPNDILPRPYIIKGVSWSPASRAPFKGPNPLGPDQPPVQYGFFFDWLGRNPQGFEVLNYWLKNQILEKSLTDLPLIKNLNANTLRILSSLGSSVEDYSRIAPEMLKVLDECYKNNLMVVMTVAISKNDLDSGRYLEVVNSYKDHPAILMWAIGNEWNINRLFGVWTIEEASLAVNQAAQTIKGIDPHHPVSSILAPNFTNPDIEGCPSVGRLKAIIPFCPNIDLWGLNVYRGISFGELFQEWQDLWKNDLQLPAKPFYLSEFGIDSFNTISYIPDGECSLRARDVLGINDFPGQADTDHALWREIKSHLSLEFPNELCLGGLIHEFNDSLWKVGSFHQGLGGLVDYDGPDNLPETPDDDHSYDDYNNEGFVLAGASPDNVLNDEHFGLVDADRQPKTAYERMREEWSESSSISISITNPADNSLVREALTIETEVKDEQGIEKVEFYLDNQALPFFVDDTSPYGAILNTKDTSDGQHIIKAKVYNQLNNSAVDEVKIIVDNTPPTVFLTQPENNALVLGEVSISASAEDETSGVAYLEFYLDGAIIGRDESSPYSTLWNSASVGDGEHFLLAKAYDLALWDATSSIRRIIVQNTPVPPQEEIKLDASIVREHKCALAINLKATSSFQPQAKLNYKIIDPNGELIKKGRLPLREHKKYYSRTIGGLPVAPYIVEVESDQGAKASTNIGAYHSPLDELGVDISLRRNWFYPKRKSLIIKAISTQQPHACLRYKIIDARDKTVKKGKMWFHRKGKAGVYKTYAPDKSFEPIYLPRGNYKLVVESTHGGRKEIDNLTYTS